MNQIVELLSYLVTLRLAALMLIQMTNASAKTHDKKHVTISPPSDIVDPRCAMRQDGNGVTTDVEQTIHQVLYDQTKRLNSLGQAGILKLFSILISEHMGRACVAWPLPWIAPRPTCNDRFEDVS
jgi:hypothetical protein